MKVILFFFLAKHLIGCIGNADNGHVNQELKVTNKQCNVQDYFNFTGDGRIMIVEKNTCITYLGKNLIENIRYEHCKLPSSIGRFISRHIFKVLEELRLVIRLEG